MSFRPSDIDSLIDWLRAQLSGVGYSSIRIPCYQTTDPQIFVYAQRKMEDPLILVIRKNRLEEEWFDAAVIDDIESRAGSREIKRLIYATSCRIISIAE